MMSWRSTTDRRGWRRTTATKCSVLCAVGGLLALLLRIPTRVQSAALLFLFALHRLLLRLPGLELVIAQLMPWPLTLQHSGTGRSCKEGRKGAHE